MIHECKNLAGNLDPNDPTYGKYLPMDLCFSIPTFYIYCFLLGTPVRDFVPEWESKVDKISLHPAALLLNSASQIWNSFEGDLSSFHANHFLIRLT